jgi:hypothetical protein
MPTCRFCGRSEKLVKAHIIPEAFFRAIGGGRDVPLLISNTSGQLFPKRQPVGVYDSGILCDACERKFDRVDAYGIKVLLQSFPETLAPLLRMGRLVGFKCSDVDQDLLKRFFIATLWRASVSTHLFYSRVALGPRYERLAKQSVLSEPLTDDFGVILSRWQYDAEHKSLVTGLMDPFRERWGDENAYRFYFGEFVAYVKVDRRPFPPDLKLFALTAGPEVLVASRDFAKSKDFAAMRHTAIGQHVNSNKIRR